MKKKPKAKSGIKPPEEQLKGSNSLAWYLLGNWRGFSGDYERKTSQMPRRGNLLLFGARVGARRGLPCAWLAVATALR